MLVIRDGKTHRDIRPSQYPHGPNYRKQMVQELPLTKPEHHSRFGLAYFPNLMKSSENSLIDLIS